MNIRDLHQKSSLAQSQTPPPYFVSRSALDSFRTAFRKMQALLSSEDQEAFERAVFRFADCGLYLQRNFSADAVKRGLTSP